MSSNPIFKNKPYEVEQLKMSKHSFSVKVNVITGQDGDFWVAISPSLNKTWAIFFVTFVAGI